jgi:hypothetical protein
MMQPFQGVVLSEEAHVLLVVVGCGITARAVIVEWSFAHNINVLLALENPGLEILNKVVNKVTT